MDIQLIVCLVIFAATFASYIINKLPLWITAMLSMGLLYITGCLDAETALAGFSNPNTILMVGMFLLAAGFQKTTFVDRLCDVTLRAAKGSFRKVFAIYIVLTVILTNLISSPVVTFSIICPILASLCEKTGTSRSRVMFPAMVVTVGCFGLLPLASAVSQASQANGFLATYGFEITMSATDYFKGKFPMLILLPLWAIFLGPKVTPKEPVTVIAQTGSKKKQEERHLTRFQDRIAVVIFFCDLLAMIFSARLGLEPWFVASAGGLLMVLFGVLDHRTAMKNIPWDILLLFVGSLALGTALTNTGAGQVVGNLMVTIVGGTKNNYILGFLFFTVPFIVTQFMQNRAVNLIFTPICLMTCKALGANPVGLVLIVSAGSLSAFLTPMATGAVAVCMAEGGYDINALLKSGWLVSLLIAVCYIAYTMTIYPAF